MIKHSSGLAGKGWIGAIALLMFAAAGCQSAEPTTSISPLPEETASPSPTPGTATDPDPASPAPASDTFRQAEPYARRPVALQDQAEPGDSFYQFREELKQAVENRDADYIRAIAAPDINLSFGPPMSLDDLNINDPNAPFWQQLDRILTVGCARYETPPDIPESAPMWVCPHVFQASLGDPFTDAYIIGSDVNVRLQPNSSSASVGVVSNEVVQVDQDAFSALTDAQRAATSTNEGWLPIITPSGDRGYVSSRYAYVPAGYRALFRQTDEGWRMTTFIVGD